MGVDIKKLNIEVSSSSDEAVKGLNKLISKIKELKTNAIQIKGLAKFKKQVDEITTMSTKLQSIADSSSKVNSLVTNINKFAELKAPNLTKLKNSVDKIALISHQLATVNIDTSKIDTLINAVRPFETLGKNNINSFLKSVERFPEVAKALDTVDMNQFASSISKVTTAIKPLATEMEKVSQGFSKLPANVQKVIANTEKLSDTNHKTSKSFNKMGFNISAVKVKMVAYTLIARRLGRALSECLDESTGYIENLNLFTVAMGEGTKEALDYANAVNKALGIDTSEFIRNQGVFKQITTGFGVVEDKANIMSKNLTQIGYDISSFFNISIEESMKKTQSGISGELEPLRRLGYALDAATLQQVAYRNGINQSINTMTQAQKSQLRYIAILQQSTNAMGDMSRTVITPSNSIRILNQQITQFKRAIGNIVSIVAVKLIPYMQVFVRLLTEGANFLAKKWGFELPTIDYSSMGNGLSNITDESETATESVKETAKAIQQLAGFDELNILPSADKSATDGLDTNPIGGYDLGLDMPEYDFLQGFNSTTDELYYNIKNKLKDLYSWLEKHKKIIKTISKLIAGLWVTSKVVKFIDLIAKLWSGFKAFMGIKKITDLFSKFTKKGVGETTEGLSKLSKVKLTAITSAIGIMAGADFGSKLAKQSLTGKDALLDIVAAGASIATAFALGGPISGTVTVIATLASGFLSYRDEVKKAEKAAYEARVEMYKMEYLYDDVGVPLEKVSAAYKDLTDEFNKRSKIFADIAEDIDELTASAGEAKETFDTVFLKFKLDASNITSDDFAELRGAIEDLYKDTKKIVDKQVEIITKGLTGVFSDTTTEIKLQNEQMAAEFFLLQNDFNQSLVDSKMEVDKIVSEIAELQENKKTGTKEYNDLMDRLGTEVTKIASLSSGDTNYVSAFDIGIKLDLEEMGKINFENPEKLEKFIEGFTEEYDIAKKGIDDTYKTQVASLNEFKNKLIVKGTPFDESLFTNAEAKFRSDRDTLVSELKSSSQSIAKKIDEQINKARQQTYDREYDTAISTKGKGNKKENEKELKRLEELMAELKSGPHYDKVKGDYDALKSQFNTPAVNAAIDTVAKAKELYDKIPLELREQLIPKVNSYQDTIDQGLTKTKKTVSKGGKEVGATFNSNLISSLASKAGSVGSTMMNLFSNGSNKGKETASYGGKSTGNSFNSNLTSTLTKGTGVLGNTIRSLFSNGSNKGKETASYGGKSTGNSFNSNLTSTLTKGTGVLGNTIRSLFSNGSNKGKETASYGGKSTGNSFNSNLTSTLTKGTGVLGNTIRSLFSNGSNKGKETASYGGKSTGNSFNSNLTSTLTKGTGVLGNTIRSLFSNGSNKGKETASYGGKSTGNSFNSNLTSTLTKGTGVLGNTITSLFSNGSNKGKEIASSSGKLAADSFNTAFSKNLKSMNELIKNSPFKKIAFNVALAFQTHINSGSTKTTTATTHASGGMPKTGDFFIANESGPELIGKIGNRSAVANTDQIADNIQAGVERAFENSGFFDSTSSNGGTVQVNVYVDSDEVASRVEKRTRANQIKSNGRG